MMNAVIKKSPFEALKNTLPDLFSSDDRIIAAYLFGSHVDGSAHEKSDLDLGIMIDPAFEKEFTISDVLDLELHYIVIAPFCKSIASKPYIILKN